MDTAIDTTFFSFILFDMPRGMSDMIFCRVFGVSASNTYLTHVWHGHGHGILSGMSVLLSLVSHQQVYFFLSLQLTLFCCVAVYRAMEHDGEADDSSGGPWRPDCCTGPVSCHWNGGLGEPRQVGQVMEIATPSSAKDKIMPPFYYSGLVDCCSKGNKIG